MSVKRVDVCLKKSVFRSQDDSLGMLIGFGRLIEATVGIILGVLGWMNW